MNPIPTTNSPAATIRAAPKRAYRVAEQAARMERLRDAAAGLADALTDYRERLYWETRLETQAETTAEQREDAMRESWAARSRVSHAMNRLRLTTPDDYILGLAAEARNATFGVQTGACTPTAAREQQYAFLAAVAEA
ncbi:hypothetical protein K4749_35970 [Streptomyces sp. TRM72054]|nr:hypothetical protein [Streptomyces sp. TRM72054]MBX9398839.1 hypothetical protein [Streptomyces sp. TRM72054]